MSESGKAIPISRKDGWQPNPRDLSTTPGGTIYATTPGGTKITYNRDTLLHLSKSPLSKTPTSLPNIPGVTDLNTTNETNTQSKPKGKVNQKAPHKNQKDEDELFHMEQ